MKLILKAATAGIFTVALTVSPASANAAEASLETQTTTEQKKPKKIKDRRHPDYVRCRSEPIIGSLARKKRVCMTNKEWAEFTRQGNKTSREMIERNQVLMQPSN